VTLEQLRILVKVVQAGSFTRAAELLGTQKSYVSRVVSQLEAELGVKLLARTTRTLSITETGREVFERAVGILGAVEDTVRVAQHAQGEPRGQLRLTCGVEFGMVAVGGWIDEYLARHPLASVEAEYTSRVLDLVHEGFDLAIRVGPVDESRLVARPLGRIDYGLFASPAYAAQRGLPQRPEQLREHALVMFTAGGHRRGWQLQRDGEREPQRIEGPTRLRVNNSFAVRDALLRGLGVGQLPLLIAREPLGAGSLVQVLPGWAGVPAPVQAVYPSNRYLSPKVRAFIDLALERLPEASERARRSTGAAAPAAPPPRNPPPNRR
jgi:DNA-binding transcriptional LysR family regulator